MIFKFNIFGKINKLENDLQDIQNELRRHMEDYKNFRENTEQDLACLNDIVASTNNQLGNYRHRTDKELQDQKSLVELTLSSLENLMKKTEFDDVRDKAKGLVRTFRNNATRIDNEIMERRGL